MRKKMKKIDRLRDLPSVDLLLQNPRAAKLVDDYGRPLTLEAIRSALAEIRQQALSHEAAGEELEGGLNMSQEQVLEAAAARLAEWSRPSLAPVINATGVILHTNLGRAPLSRAALETVKQVSGGYSNLEYDLERGARGSRLAHAEGLLKRLTGAEAALVVNNNASAVLLALAALARRKRVIISRSQLIEIGGGFRIPDVLLQSGAKLVEVGTTNRVHLRDYTDALAEGAAFILRAHQSNFRIIGFTAEPGLAELARAAHEHQVFLVDDLGSGVLLDTARFGMAHEPTVQESLAAGADLVCFSGDKLLGGPQAGILVGKEGLVAKLRKHPLARAVRADKLCLAALSATLLHYLKDEAEREIPVWRMIAAPADRVQSRAACWARALGVGEVIPAQSTVGGGSLPGETLPTFVLALHAPQPNRFLARLRRLSPPVIARVEEDRVLFDPRTVLEEEEGALLTGLRSLLTRE
jgi:L-seryl-tRNA(Ser) seleniumtransferase